MLPQRMASVVGLVHVQHVPTAVTTTHVRCLACFGCSGTGMYVHCLPRASRLVLNLRFKFSS